MNAPTVSSTRRALMLGSAAVLAAFSCAQFNLSAAAEVAVKIPAPGADLVTEANGPQEVAVFAGGCFWGVQGVFQHTKGVIQAVSGYAGGAKQTAIYEMVGSGLTGHAEAVKITFDPKQITYAQLLQIYFSVVHDPTQLNRQGPDSGTQYRSAVFTTSASQKMVTEKYVAQLDAVKVFPAKIVTQVAPLNAFYAAEAHHQDYATLHPESGYIARFDLPKIANLKSTFPQLWREQPVLVMAKRS
jgi:peptide-methionine (S)-S-oxide reductase